MKEEKRLKHIPFETCFYWETYPKDTDIQTIKLVLLSNIKSFIFENGLNYDDARISNIETKIVPCPQKEGFNIVCKSVISVEVYYPCENVVKYKIKKRKGE